ncbi:zonadhesin [Perkinsela sp. CCAP 1560/4]|nr:zonadhesin [Perkinsela sp. CCAP 1560/4]|eukprot:KNH05877.1 zonadhesin [Perkinsela sp. CCAP 1560/4]
MTQTHRYVTRSSGKNVGILRCKEEKDMTQDSRETPKITVGDLFKKAAKNSETKVQSKTSEPQKQPDLQKQKEKDATREPKHSTRSRSKNTCESALPWTKPAEPIQSPEGSQPPTDAQTDILSESKPVETSVSDLFTKAAIHPELNIQLKTSNPPKQPDLQRQENSDEAPREPKRPTRENRKRISASTVPLAKPRKQNPVAKDPQKLTDSRTNILPDTFGERTNNLSTLLDISEQRVLAANRRFRLDEANHLLQLSDPLTECSIDGAVSIEALKFSFTIKRGDSIDSNYAKVLFSANLDEYGLMLLVLECFSDNHTKMCDLVFASSGGIPLRRFRIAEDDIIAFHAEKVALPARKFLGLSHGNNLHTGIRVAFATKKQVYIIDCHENEIREIRALADQRPNDTTAPPELEEYYTWGHALSQKFKTCIHKNGIRFLLQAQSLMVVMTDGSIFVFRLDSGTFTPVYFTNLFQREHIELLRIEQKKRPNSFQADVGEFILLERAICELEIDSRSKTYQNAGDSGLIDAFPTVHYESITFAITADHHLLVLTVGIFGDVLVDHYEAARNPSQKVLPLLCVETEQISIIHLDGNKLRILVPYYGGLSELFLCELSTNAEAPAQEDQTFNFAGWLGTERNISLSSKKNKPMNYRFSSRFLSIEGKQGLVHVSKVAPSSTLGVWNAREIIDNGLQSKYPSIKHTDAMWEEIICAVPDDPDAACCLLRIRGN